MVTALSTLTTTWTPRLAIDGGMHLVTVRERAVGPGLRRLVRATARD